jgi:hypothetical protein
MMIKKSYVLLSTMLLGTAAYSEDMTVTAPSASPSAVKLSASTTLENGSKVEQGSLKKTDVSSSMARIVLGAKISKFSANYIGEMSKEGEGDTLFTRNELATSYALAGTTPLFGLSAIAKFNFQEQDPITTSPIQRVGLSADSSAEISTILGNVTPYANLTVLGRRAERATEVVGVSGLSQSERDRLGVNENKDTKQTTVTDTDIFPRTDYTLGVSLVPAGASKLTLGMEMFVRRDYKPVYTLNDKADGFKVDRLASATPYSYVELSAAYQALTAVSVYSKMVYNITTANNDILLTKDLAKKPLELTLGLSATLL